VLDQSELDSCGRQKVNLTGGVFNFVRASTCREIFSIQSAGLAKRLKHAAGGRVIIAISGGLDSTLALLAAVHCFRFTGVGSKG